MYGSEYDEKCAATFEYIDRASENEFTEAEREILRRQGKSN
jgi:hypothetical protein